MKAIMVKEEAKRLNVTENTIIKAVERLIDSKKAYGVLDKENEEWLLCSPKELKELIELFSSQNTSLNEVIQKFNIRHEKALLFITKLLVDKKITGTLTKEGMFIARKGIIDGSQKRPKKVPGKIPNRDTLVAKGVRNNTISLLYDRVLYPSQELLFVANGKVMDSNGSKEGLICVTNRSITLYQPRKWHNREIAYDYLLTKVKKQSYNRGWFSSEIMIQMEHSRNVILQGINKGEEEQIINYLKKSIEQYYHFIEGQRSSGLFPYGLEIEQWGSKDEAQRWFEQYMNSRGFQKSGNGWLTKEDYERQQKGLYTYIENGIQKKGTIDDVLDGFSPSQFEEFISLLFKAMGYEATNLPYVADYGADILLEKKGEITVVQVKKWSGKVGAPTVQKALGSMWKYDATKAILITTGAFTQNAYKQAEGAPIELWNGRKLKDELEQHLPSHLISQKSIPTLLFPQIERICNSIISELVSNAEPRTAMRITLDVDRSRRNYLGFHILCPLYYIPLLEKVVKEYTYRVPMEFKQFIKNLVTTIKNTELKRLQNQFSILL